MNIKQFKKNAIVVFLLFITIFQSNIAYAEGLGDVVSGGDSFILAADEQKIDETNLKNTSNIIYNIALSIGIIVAVIYAAILGVQFMLASAENKAQVIESMVPFFVGCIVVFSAFAIWKAIILVLN